MIKKHLNENQKKLFDLTIRPTIMYYMIIGIILILGIILNTLSMDEINTYIKSMGLCMIINYLNLTFIEIKEIEKEKK